MKSKLLLFVTALVFNISFSAKAQWIDFSNKQGQKIKAAEIANNFEYLKNNTDKARVDAAVLNHDMTYGYLNAHSAVMVFNHETKDTTGIYDPTNGVVTADKDMTIIVDISLWGESNAISGVAFLKTEKSTDGGGTWNTIQDAKVAFNASDRVGAELHSQYDLSAGEMIRFVLYNTASNKKLNDGSPVSNTLRISEL